MEEQSFLSSGAITTNRSSDLYDFNSSSRQFICASKYKGVVSQQNGHWGAQIYANHQRVWLGTFKSETEAAMAYDSAAIKLRNGDPHRNFPWTQVTTQEPKFQSQFSALAVLGMIKDGSYNAQFADYRRAQAQRSYNLGRPKKLTQLFQKELTPSDVSKLNRLVIPKKYAVKYFPPICDAEEARNGGPADDVELMFYDRAMRSWAFRYCYWKSSQSFVFTRGWNRFAKDKGLKPKDRVIFSAYEKVERSSESRRRMCFIDVAYNDGSSTGGGGSMVVDDGGDEAATMGRNGIRIMDHVDKTTTDNEGEGEDEMKVDVSNAEKKGVLLFGVRIF